MKKMMERNVLALMCALATGVAGSGSVWAADDAEVAEIVIGENNPSCLLPTTAAGTRVKTAAELQTALENARNNGLSDTIIIERQTAGDLSNTITLSDGLVFTDTDRFNLTLISEDPCNPHNFVIQGVAGQRSLSISNASSGATVTIKGLTFAGGSAGLYVDNYSLKVENAIFSDMDFGDNEGGIAIETLNGTVNLDYVNILRNTTTNHEFASAIRIDGTGSTFIKNSVFEGNGSLALGVWNDGLAIDRSRFSANTTSVGPGALYSKSNVDIRNSVFESNTTTDTAPGAIYSERAIDLINSRFTSNRSSQGPGVALAEFSLEVLNSTFDGNSAVSGQGAVLWSSGTALGYQVLIQNSVFTNNVTGETDGEGTSAIGCNSKCKVVNSYFSGNEVHSLVVAFRDGAADDNILLNNVFDLPDPAVANRYIVTSGAKVSVYNNAFKSSQSELLNVPEDKLFETNNISVADLLLDSNLVPQDGSPLIDAGLRIDALFPETDYLLNARLVGAAVDIGPAEYGVSSTKPQIRTFALADGSSNLVIDFVELQIEFIIADASTLVDVLFDDGSGVFSSIMPDTVSTRSFLHKLAFAEPGNKTLRLKVVDSRGEEDIETRVLTIEDASTQNVVDSIKDTCVNDPDNCALDLAAIKTLYQNQCKNDPESCGVDVAGIQTDAKKDCQENPQSCTIPSEFDKNDIPTAQGNWILMGASAAMSESELKINFNTVDVVWAYVDGQWKAYSGNDDTAAFLQAEGVPVLTELPEYSGFWLRK